MWCCRDGVVSVVFANHCCYCGGGGGAAGGGAGGPAAAAGGGGGGGGSGGGRNAAERTVSTREWHTCVSRRTVIAQHLVSQCRTAVS